MVKMLTEKDTVPAGIGDSNGDACYYDILSQLPDAQAHGIIFKVVILYNSIIYSRLRV